MTGEQDATQIDPFDDEQEKDRFFCPSRIPRTSKANLLIQEVISRLDEYEKAIKTRTRRRKTKDQEIYITTVTAIVCDLAHYVLSDDHRAMVVSRSKAELGKADRYKHPAMNQRLPYVLDVMSSKVLQWVTQKKGHHFQGGAKQKTIITPSEKFNQLVATHSLSCDDFGNGKVQELIELKGHKEGHGKRAETIDYKDTEQTCLYRTQIRTINEFIECADIEFDRKVLRRLIAVDTSARQLYRSFTRGSFESGGRLFGGFWMNLSKEERLRGLRINGERVIGVDYKTSALRILYGISGKIPPRDDLYEIKGIDPKWRDGIKKLLNALTFSDRIPLRKPRDTSKILPKNNVATLCKLIVESHPDLAQYLPSQIGHRIQFIESEILIEVMMRLMDKGVVSLPIHDCVIVPETARYLTESIMTHVFYHMVGIQGTVSIECMSDINR